MARRSTLAASPSSVDADADADASACGLRLRYSNSALNAMARLFSSLAATTLAALGLQGCVIVTAPQTSSPPPPWRQPQSSSTPVVASRPPGRCGGDPQTPEQIFAVARDGVAVVSSGSGQGSAFVVRQEAGRTLLLTNAHVVAGASEV
ncbi:periplasmic serine proteinase [Cyanobium sp. PCC 7001]|uniref:hypothetical protein n=1 Tax=Cyanobium sp. PCC 7001 TaxID=180281 RepID=UPI00018056A5|nr:hypothetical protein [Cyanobium sp. PCC 7001]EDY37919.1 periplasmic serine proteinase [Cyanobium sp. PCC 7001]